MKIALMRRYDLTEDGYRRKFRTSKPEIDESPDQFIVRLSTYLIQWLELSKIEKSLNGLKNLIVKEQFINSCPKEITVHLRERAPETLEEMAKIADQYLEAHGKHVFSPVVDQDIIPVELNILHTFEQFLHSSFQCSGGIYHAKSHLQELV